MSAQARNLKREEESRNSTIDSLTQEVAELKAENNTLQCKLLREPIGPNTPTTLEESQKNIDIAVSAYKLENHNLQSTIKSQKETIEENTLWINKIMPILTFVKATIEKGQIIDSKHGVYKVISDFWKENKPVYKKELLTTHTETLKQEKG